MLWSGLANDLTGILLFLLWLLLPPVYVAVLGRRYVEQCADSAHQAVWAHEALRQALDDLEAAGPSGEQAEPPAVPSARDHRSDETHRVTAVSAPTVGRHRLRADRSTLLARASA